MPNRQIEEILSLATQDVRKLIEAAFEAGRADMRRELFALLTDNNRQTELAPIGSLADFHETIDHGNGRAPSGTVKPAIKDLIKNSANGIRASDIIERTGFKDNSVRGTLAALRAEGFAERRGEFWYLSQRKGPLTAASEPS